MCASTMPVSTMRRDASPLAVLFDRDGTLVVDVPYNADPERVRPMPLAARAVGRLRDAGILTGVVSNQSGIGRGLITREQLDAVNARVDAELGPFDTWQCCPHTTEDHCACRKPEPGLVLRAAEALGVRPEQTVVIGDIGADVLAARRAGAVGVLVPTPATLRAEVEAAAIVAADLEEAVDLILERVSAGSEGAA